MNKKAASGKLQMLDNYTKYRFLIFYAELDGGDSTLAHTYILPVNTDFNNQMASINQWGSSNANSVEVLLTPATNEISVFQSYGGSIIAIDAF